MHGSALLHAQGQTMSLIVAITLLDSVGGVSADDLVVINPQAANSQHQVRKKNQLVTCCFPHLPVVNESLRFCQIDRVKLIESKACKP